MGGNFTVLNSLDGSGGYALVGGTDADRPAVEASGAVTRAAGEASPNSSASAPRTSGTPTGRSGTSTSAVSSPRSTHSSTRGRESSPFTKQDFVAVQGQLAKEFPMVTNVRDPIKSWQQIFSEGSTVGLVDVSAIADKIQADLKTPSGSGIGFDPLSMIGIFQGVLAIAGGGLNAASGGATRCHRRRVRAGIGPRVHLDELG